MYKIFLGTPHGLDRGSEPERETNMTTSALDLESNVMRHQNLSYLNNFLEISSTFHRIASHIPTLTICKDDEKCNAQVSQQRYNFGE